MSEEIETLLLLSTLEPEDTSASVVSSKVTSTTSSNNWTALVSKTHEIISELALQALQQ